MGGVIDDQSGRILALESTLVDAQRSLTAHDLLLRALLTHLALGDPGAFARLRHGVEQAEIYRDQGLSGAMTRDVAEIITAMLDEITAGVSDR